MVCRSPTAAPTTYESPSRTTVGAVGIHGLPGGAHRRARIVQPKRPEEVQRRAGSSSRANPPRCSGLEALEARQTHEARARPLRMPSRRRARHRQPCARRFSTRDFSAERRPADRAGSGERGTPDVTSAIGRWQRPRERPRRRPGRGNATPGRPEARAARESKRWPRRDFGHARRRESPSMTS